MINFIVYSHTDYRKILNIQADYLSGLGNITLFINYNESLLEDTEYNFLISRFHNVIYYSDSDPYATRLLTCLKHIDSEYFLFLHEIDIVLDLNPVKISEFYNFLKINNFDRIDLKHTYNLNTSCIINADDGLHLVKSENPKDYIYNVNPSIWKKESFVKMLSAFKNETYRGIEFKVQEYCTQFNIFKLHSHKPLQCGWFICDSCFKFLHVVHFGKVLPMNSNYVTPSQQSYIDAKDEYIDMYHKYDMGNINLASLPEYTGD